MAMVRVLGLIALFLLVTTGGTSAFAEPVGQVIEVSGDALVIRDGRHIPLNKQLMLDEADIIVTRAGGNVRLKMQDDSELYIGPRSSVSLQQYAVKGKTRIFSRLAMFWGKVRFVVSKLADRTRSFEVQTRTAVIGVRGTDFTVQLSPGPGFQESAEVQRLTQYSQNGGGETTIPFPANVEAVTVTVTSGSVQVTIQGTGETRILKAGDSMTVNKDGTVTLTQKQVDGSSKVTELAVPSAATSSTVQGVTITTPYPYK